MLKWEQVAGEFYRDGSWRDIYVLNTDIEDWQRALDALRNSPFRLRYRREATEGPFPSRAADAFPETGLSDRLLSVDLDGPIANAHFFTASEIEFDLDPREISGQRELDAVIRFMRLLADATGRDCILTPENAQDIAILRVRPNDPVVVHNRFGLGHS